MYVNINFFPKDGESQEYAEKLALLIRKTMNPTFKYTPVFVTPKEGNQEQEEE